MTRETELHFSNIPSIDISRCKLAKGHDHKTTFNTGDIIPIFVDDIIPGTTVKMRESELVRMMTPIAPVMDNAYLDIMFFFTPNRLLWDHWVNFMGENDTAPWTQQQNYTVPKITCPSGGWAEGSLADYLGLPTKVYGSGWKANALPFRAYVKIYNDWFRDENNQNPIYMSTGDSDTTGKNVDANYDKVTYTECGAKPLKACKIHDYFTSALPGPQKGPSISIPIGDEAPVIGVKHRTSSGSDWTAGIDQPMDIIRSSTDSYLMAEDGTAQTQGTRIGLAVDLSTAIGATVNQLRQAFAVQKFYERAARGGWAKAF